MSAYRTSAWWLVALTITSGLRAQTPTDPQANVLAARPIPRAIAARRGVVVSVSEPASIVGADVLRHGGNAVDAAVATAFALAVTHPPAGNIGGGGFMMILRGPGSQPTCLEYRETAPDAARPDMFTPKETRLGGKAVGTPGTVRGLAMAHTQFGVRPWRELIDPAALLAREGFAVDASLAKSLNEVLQDEDSRHLSGLRHLWPSSSEFRRYRVDSDPQHARTVRHATTRSRLTGQLPSAGRVTAPRIPGPSSLSG